jgi:PncC family amidohydrolase
MAQDASVLAGLLARRIKRAEMFIATAESCTGGMIASALTDIQGASRWFTQGWITYSNESKIKQLGIDESIFVPDEGSAGAVSSEVAEAMAIGAAKNSGADMTIAVTGIAGPTGSTEAKEVGLVWVGIFLDDKVTTKCAEFGQGDRHSNKEAFTTFALRVALEVWGEHNELQDAESESSDEDDSKTPTSVPAALNLLDEGPQTGDWHGDVAWSEGDEEPKPDSDEDPAIPDSDIVWSEE